MSNDSGAPIFAKQLEALKDYVDGSASHLSPESAFAARILRDQRLPSLALSQNDLERNRMAEAPVLAVAGYLMEDGLVDDLVKTEWLQAFARLSARDPFPPDRASFFFRPAELLGICLGSHWAPAADTHREWLKKVLSDGESQMSTDFWTAGIARCAATECDVDWSATSSKPIDQMDFFELAIAYWLVRMYPRVAQQLNIGDKQPQLESHILRAVGLSTIQPTDITRAAVAYWAAQEIVGKYIESSIEKYWQVGRDRIDTLSVLSNIFARFPLFARQLTVRYENRATVQIKDEYDVQDLVHALLKLHFDDIRPEEHTPSYASSTSRTDFLLKPQQVMVEIKMTRKNLGQKEVTNQLIIDKERYKTHQDCKHLVCFVYDPTNKIKNPHAVESDVAQDGGGLLPVTVIVSPKGV